VKSFGKDHSEYWKKRLKKRTFANGDGEIVEISGWQVYVAHKKIRRWFNTGLSNKSEAALKARDFYRDLVANGWDFVDKKYNLAKASDPLQITIGEYLGFVGKTAILRHKTLATYTRKLKTLVAESQSIDDSKKHDYVHGGSQGWNKEVESVPLRRLSEESVRKWMRKRVQNFQGNDYLLNKAKITINTLLRNSKSLFSPRILEAVRFRRD
jgi:hypothetical protein